MPFKMTTAYAAKQPDDSKCGEGLKVEEQKETEQKNDLTLLSSPALPSVPLHTESPPQKRAAITIYVPEVLPLSP